MKSHIVLCFCVFVSIGKIEEAMASVERQNVEIFLTRQVKVCVDLLILHTYISQYNICTCVYMHALVEFFVWFYALSCMLTHVDEMCVIRFNTRVHV